MSSFYSIIAKETDMSDKVEEFKQFVKNSRENHVLTANKLVDKASKALMLESKSNEYFLKNASKTIEALREECWQEFLKAERSFTRDMLLSLIDEKQFREMKGNDAVTYYVMEFPEEIYALSLSNTQSRRARAGKEFELIIEKVFKLAGIDVESQGEIAKGFYEENNLSKLVDLIIPSAEQFQRDKRKCIFVTAKTTLRERWQEIPEEMNRTGINVAYLATLDKTISDNVEKLLYEGNIVITTTKQIKEECYSNNDHIITFEDLLEIALKLSR